MIHVRAHAREILRGSRSLPFPDASTILDAQVDMPKFTINPITLL